jgi:hypothetical protein
MPTKGPWGNAASHLRTLHAEEANLQLAKQLAVEEEAAAKLLASQQNQSKLWALEKAALRHKRISYLEKDISGNKIEFSESTCDGKCMANMGTDGWWHCGCDTHCYCNICKKKNTKWMGMD